VSRQLKQYLFGAEPTGQVTLTPNVSVTMAHFREIRLPYTLPALIGALAEVINLLGRAIRGASPDPHPVFGNAHREHRTLAHDERMCDNAQDAGI
jgi:hypothetical protein